MHTPHCVQSEPDRWVLRRNFHTSCQQKGHREQKSCFPGIQNAACYQCKYANPQANESPPSI